MSSPPQTVQPGEYLNDLTLVHSSATASVWAGGGMETDIVHHEKSLPKDPQDSLDVITADDAEEAQFALICAGYRLDDYEGNDYDNPLHSVLNNRYKICQHQNVFSDRTPEIADFPADRPFNALGESGDSRFEILSCFAIENIIGPSVPNAVTYAGEPPSWGKYTPSVETGEVTLSVPKDQRITISRELWTELTPVFQLVSTLVKHEKYTEWWLTLKSGTVSPLPQETIEEMTARGGWIPDNEIDSELQQGLQRIGVLHRRSLGAETPSVQQTAIDDIADCWNTLNQYLSFHLDGIPDKYDTNFEAGHARYSIPEFSHGAWSEISIGHAEWRPFAIRAEERAAGVPLHLRSYPPELELRSNFRLTHLILHELGHAFNAIFHPFRGVSCREPFYEDGIVAELGYDTEIVYFGGTWQDPMEPGSSTSVMPAFIGDFPFVGIGSDSHGRARRRPLKGKKMDWSYAVPDDYIRKMHDPNTYVELATNPDASLHPPILVAKVYGQVVVHAQNLFTSGDPADLALKNDIVIGCQLSAVLAEITREHHRCRAPLQVRKNEVNARADAACDRIGQRQEESAYVATAINAGTVILGNHNRERDYWQAETLRLGALYHAVPVGQAWSPQSKALGAQLDDAVTRCAAARDAFAFVNDKLDELTGTMRGLETRIEREEEVIDGCYVSQKEILAEVAVLVRLAQSCKEVVLRRAADVRRTWLETDSAKRGEIFPRVLFEPGYAPELWCGAFVGRPEYDMPDILQGRQGEGHL